MNPDDCSRARICDNPNLEPAAVSIGFRRKRWTSTVLLEALCDECPLRVAVEAMDHA